MTGIGLWTGLCGLAVAAALAAAVPAAAEGGPPVPRAALKHLRRCPALEGYADSDASAALVARCLGRPAGVRREADGRFAYVYTLKHRAGVVAFLFDASGRLIRPVARPVARPVD